MIMPRRGTARGLFWEDEDQWKGAGTWRQHGAPPADKKSKLVEGLVPQDEQRF
jgi:hypothetical protein